MIILNELLMYITIFFGLFTSIYFLITLYENRDKIFSPEPKRFPLITIIIPDYGHPQELKTTIKSLLALNYPKDKLEILVVINGLENNLKKQAYQIALNYKNLGIKTFYIGNVGKGGAINHGLKFANGEFVGVLDADCFCEQNALRKIVPYFENTQVMAVTPSIQIANANTFLQKLQKIEFMVGVFLRKCFGFLGSIHITPGPFTIYRKAFFDKFGPYDESTITEDIEIALRIQHNNYVIENAIDSLVYTSGVKEFWPLFNQRIRWYRGFIDNVVKYKDLFGAKTGNLGLFILPGSFFSIGLTSLLIGINIINLIKKGIQLLINWNAINFSFTNLINLNLDTFYISQNSITIFSIISMILALIVLNISKYLAQEKESIKLSFIFHFIFYWFLFVAWWSTATYYFLVGKKIKWGPREG